MFLFLRLQVGRIVFSDLAATAFLPYLELFAAGEIGLAAAVHLAHDRRVGRLAGIVGGIVETCVSTVSRSVHAS